MGWLDRQRDRISNILERIRERIYRPPSERAEERRVVYEKERVVEERFKVTVYEKAPVELRPFSSLYQYSAKTRTYRDRTTGKFTSKVDYKFALKQWRLDMAGQYIEMTHPDWSERAITEAVLRLEELRAKPELTAMDEIEIGEIFTPP